MGERRCAYRVLVGKPEGKRPLGRPRRRWEDTTKMDLQEVGWGNVDCMTWLRIGTGAGNCKRGNELSRAIKCGELLD
jgi:hypothetical protein